VGHSHTSLASLVTLVNCQQAITYFKCTSVPLGKQDQGQIKVQVIFLEFSRFL